MATNTLQKTLSELYYSSHGYNSPARLLKAVKEAGHPKVSLKQVEEWISTQEVPSRFRQRRVKFPRSITIARSANYQWSMDLGMLPSLKRYNQNYVFFLLCISSFSRFIKGIKPLKDKKSKTVAKALREIIQENGVAPEVALTDQGSEFAGDVNSVYDQYNIKHWTSLDTTGPKASHAENGVKLFKNRLFRVLRKHRTYNWVHFIDFVKENINNEFCRTVGMTRNEADRPENQNKVYRYAFAHREIKRLATIKPNIYKYSIGTVCRVSKGKGAFLKSYEGSYSEVLYKIVDRSIRGGVEVYTLANFLDGSILRGKFYSPELKPVSKVSIKQNVQQIHSFRLTPEGGQEIQVTLRGSKIRKWLPYTDIIEYQE